MSEKERLDLSIRRKFKRLAREIAKKKRRSISALLDEQAFRFNERKDNDASRFAKALRSIVGKGLRYAKLIGGECIQQAGQTA